MPELEAHQWAWAIAGAIFVGLGKGGLPGLGNLTAGIFAMVFAAKASVGLLLPVLACADIAAIIVYRREARWEYVLKLLPPAMVGVLLGWLMFDSFEDRDVEIVIGVVLLGMTALHFLRQWRIRRQAKPDTAAQTRAFAWFTGVLGGVATMLANAAGPVAAMYLMAVGLPKIAFVGTSAWFFFSINLFKIPFQVELGNITFGSIGLSLILGLFAAGAVPLAPYILRHINEKLFAYLVWFFVVVGGVRLLIG